MKCIRMKSKREEILRVSDDQAHELVKHNEAEYVSKSEWKKQVRKIVEKVEEKIKKVAKLAKTDEETASMLVKSMDNLKKGKVGDTFKSDDFAEKKPKKKKKD